MKSFINFIFIIILSFILLSKLECQEYTDFQGYFGGYIDYRIIKSSIENPTYLMLSTDLEFGYFLDQNNLIGLNLNINNQYKKINSNKEKQNIWIINGFYQRYINRFFIKVGVGYGRNLFKSLDDNTYNIVVLSVDIGSGIIFSLTENIKIPISIGYSYRKYCFFNYKDYSKNQYLNNTTAKIGINYYFR